MVAEIEDDGTGGDEADVLAGDPMLTFLSETAALVYVGIEVTLLTNGMTVAGRLIDEFSYLQCLADHLQRQQEAQAKHAGEHPDLAAMLRDQVRGVQPGTIIGSDYVHLQDATISRGAGDVLHVALWRGAAEDIAGWSVG